MGIECEYHPNVSFKYEFSNKTQTYWPDFRVDGVLIEIKGDHFLKEDGTWRNPFDSSQDGLYEAKRQCALRNGVKILYGQDYLKYVEYVKTKYGRNYLSRFKTGN